MHRNLHVCALVVVVLILTISCSDNSGSATSPELGNEGVKAVTSTGSSQVCLGMWQLSADKTTGAVEVVQLRNADKIALLVDHTKIGKKAWGRTCALEDIDVLITDDKAPLEYLEEFRSRGVVCQVV